MAVQRNVFIFAFLFVSFLLWQAWKNHSIPSVSHNKKQSVILHVSNNIKKNYIFIKNDVMSLAVNMYGGDIEESNLLEYKDHLHSLKPLKLLETKDDFIYQAQSGLIGRDGLDDLKNNNRPLYFSNKNFFELAPNDRTMSVPITYIGKNGVIYVKKFILTSGQYNIKVEYEIYNSTNQNIELCMFGQLKQTKILPKKRDIYSNNFALQTFRGAAYSSENKKYEKYKFETISRNENLHLSTENGWIAMLQQYFATAWIPEKSMGKNIIYTANINDETAAIGYTSSLINIPSHSHKIIKSMLWIGPEIQKKMALVAPHLDLTVDYGWLWFLSQPLFHLLSFLYKIIGNWGFSIIAITLIMRAITYPLTKAQYVSMIKMRMIQPKINELKKRFESDKKRMSQEMMLLYKREKINPLSGFLPVFIQMPIFLSLYYMLMGSVELRHAPFVFWIKDLSSQDPYYILPVLMGLTMFCIHKMSSDNISDPFQKKIMNAMPIIFTVFFLWFPSGLVLYYIISNIITIIQQKFIASNLYKNNKMIK